MHHSQTYSRNKLDKWQIHEFSLNSFSEVTGQPPSQTQGERLLRREIRCEHWLTGGVNAAGQTGSARGTGEFMKAKCILTRESEEIRGCRNWVGEPTSSS